MLASLKDNPDLHFNPEAVSRVIKHPDKDGAALVFFNDAQAPIEFAASATDVAGMMNNLVVQQKVGMAQAMQQASAPPRTLQFDPAALRGTNGRH